MFTLKSDHSAKEGFKSCTILIGDVELNLMIDLGAKISIINESLYKYYLEYPLSTSKQTLLSYNNGLINILGVVYLTVKYQEEAIDSFPFYVTRQGTSLKGI